MSYSLRPHGLQPTRLLRPWGFPGKSTGVGCHFLLLVNHHAQAEGAQEWMPSSLSPRPLTCFLSVGSDQKPEGRRPIWRNLCWSGSQHGHGPRGLKAGPGGKWSVSRWLCTAAARDPCSCLPHRPRVRKAPHFPTSSISAAFILHTTCTQSL